MALFVVFSSVDTRIADVGEAPSSIQMESIGPTIRGIYHYITSEYSSDYNTMTILVFMLSFGIFLCITNLNSRTCEPPYQTQIS